MRGRHTSTKFCAFCGSNCDMAATGNGNATGNGIRKQSTWTHTLELSIAVYRALTLPPVSAERWHSYPIIY